MRFDGKVVCTLDASAVLDAGVTSIPASSGSTLTVVAKTPKSIQKIRYIDNTGKFIGVYKGAIGVEEFVGTIGGGFTAELECVIPNNTRVSFRSMQGVAITSGTIACDFLSRTDS